MLLVMLKLSSAWRNVQLGTCAARAGKQLWPMWIKPPAKNRQGKCLEQPPGHTCSKRIPSLSLDPAWDGKKIETCSGT